MAWKYLEKPGRPQSPYWLTRFIFLRLIGFIYFFAFLSLAYQVVPLVGENGILPARLYLERAQSALGSSWNCWTELPTLFWLSVTDGFLQSMAWVGVALSAIVLVGFANVPFLAALWFLYLSFNHIAQIWFGYGWEIQLLETGFLAIFLCPLLDPRPFPRCPPPGQVMWLLRWLIFRIMLGAGLIKIRGDECWRDLTCLYYHYETQPIPNPLSRLFHQLPRWFHRLSVLWNHFTELVVPWFAFWPAWTRRMAGLLFILFQLILILSGNLSFLNWLTICPAIACLDDAFWRRVLPCKLVAWADRAAAEARPSTAQQILVWLLVLVVALLSVAPVRNLFTDKQIMNTSFNQLHLVNTYGAFGSVDRERLEIILEGTDANALTADTQWKAYEFKAKPGDPNRLSPWISPYHYRIDWQIWFAYRWGGPSRHPWLVHLMWKLLHNDPGVLSLFANHPFPDRPPRTIRAELYRYRFTPPGEKTPPYWIRERVGSWLEPVSKDDIGLKMFLERFGWLPKEN